jgi:sporulation protein YlmC with PRC-barrel domain
MRKPFHVAFLAFAFIAAVGFFKAGSLNTVVADDKDAKDNQANVNVAHVFRSGEIIGLPVKNREGEHLGKIDDLVIDMKSGEVRYAALSFGGFAGLGSKLFAVPFEKMMFVFGEPNKTNSRHLIFEVTKDQLEKAPGFDSSHWPNVADAQWSASIDKHYNVNRKEQVKTDNDANAPKVAYETVFRASNMKGMDVRNDHDENLGSVDEIVIDVTKGQVKYVALSFGSWFTGGNKLFAVPLTSFTLKHANEKTFLVTHHSQESLKNAPGFDRHHWPDTADVNWAKGIDSYYERTAQRPTTRQ